MTHDKRMPMEGANDLTVAEGGMLNLKHSTSAHIKFNPFVTQF